MDIERCLSDKNAVLVCGGGKTVLSHNADRAFRSASVIKIYILAYYLASDADMRRVIDIDAAARISSSVITELGMRSADIGTLLTLMIASSDNTATNILINDAGTDRLNAFCREVIGTKNTVIGRVMLDYAAAEEGRDNLTCLNDCKKCLEYCVAYPLGRGILSKQKCRDRIARYIYGDIPFYGKCGEIPGVYNDVALIGDTFAGVFSDGMDKRRAAVLCGLAGLLAVGADAPVIK